MEAPSAHRAGGEEPLLLLLPLLHLPSSSGPPRGKRCPKWKRRRLQMGLPPPPPVEARNPQGTLPLPLISPRGESSSSTPFWDSGLERERGSCPGLLEPTLREAETTPMKDGLTVVLNPDMEKNVAKQRDLSAAPPCVEGWLEEELSKLFHFSKVLGMPVEGHGVEILALLKKLKLRIGSNTLSKRRKKKKSCTTRFERELTKLECSVSYGGDTRDN